MNRSSFGKSVPIGVAALVSVVIGSSLLVADISIDGSSDQIQATGGTLGFGNENLVTTGTTTTGGLTVSGLDCTGNANGGALTADQNGIVSCSDDASGGAGVVLMLHGGAFINLNDQTRFGFLHQTNQTDEGRVLAPISRSGTLKNLRVVADPALDNAASVDVTVRVNETDTALSLTYSVADGTSVVSNLSDSVAVTAGDLVSISMAETAGGDPVGTQFNVTFELES